MLRRTAPLLAIAALALTSCAAAVSDAPAPSTPPATSAAPTTSAAGDDSAQQFLRDVRMKARDLDAGTIDDDALLRTGEQACDSVDDEGLRDKQLLNARVNQGYTGEEARTVFASAERWLCDAP